MAHAGHIDIQLLSLVEKFFMLRIGFRIRGRRIPQYLCDVHPGAIGIAAESFNEVHAGG